jgi:hypothetical protein
MQQSAAVFEAYYLSLGRGHCPLGAATMKDTNRDKNDIIGLKEKPP